MSLEKIINNIEKCRECKENVSTVFCKECNSYLCQKCWELMNNSLLIIFLNLIYLLYN